MDPSEENEAVTGIAQASQVELPQCQPLALPADDGTQIRGGPNQGFRLEGAGRWCCGRKFSPFWVMTFGCEQINVWVRRLLSNRSVIGKRPEIRPVEHELAKVRGLTRRAVVILAKTH